jgi:hypothetical protein
LDEEEKKKIIEDDEDKPLIRDRADVSFKVLGKSG